jgi:hypothetical protein
VNFLPLTVKGGDQLEDLDVDGSLIDIKEDGRTWIGLMWFRIGTNGGLL